MHVLHLRTPGAGREKLATFFTNVMQEAVTGRTIG